MVAQEWPADAAALSAGGELSRILRPAAAMRRILKWLAIAGGALLAVHEKLGTPGAEFYRTFVRSGGAPGHLAAVQGLVGRGVGLTLTACEILSAHTLSVGLLGAALRLGMIGHLDAQRSLQQARELIADILAVPAPGVETISAFTPEAEIAVMRHETAETRLFAN